MFDIGSALTMVFAREFYRLNAGFFMIVITLTFGFMSGVEHKALAEFFVASPHLTMFPVAVWAIYTIKIVGFNSQRIALPENNFLYALSLLPYSRQLTVGLQTLFLQFAPVSLYGLFLILTAIKNGFFQPVMIIVGSIALLLFMAVAFLLRSLQTPIRENKISSLKKFIDQHTVRPLWWIYTTTILRREPILFIGTKVFGGLLLFAVMKLYENETYDSRLLAMAASVAGIGNFMVMMQLQLFDLKYFSFMKNLPIKLFMRWSRVALVTLIAVVPELILVMKYSPALGLSNLVAILVLIPSIALTAYSLLYFTFRDENTYSRLTFGITIAHLILILFKVPVWSIALLDLTASWLLFRAKYYSFEISTVTKK